MIYSANNTAYITNVLINISVDRQSVGVVCSCLAFVLVVFTDFRPLQNISSVDISLQICVFQIQDDCLSHIRIIIPLRVA